MLTWALKYLQLGFSVIPLKAFGKEPLIDWKEFQKRKATEQEVRKWFVKWPQMNLGIVTGAISNIIVIDLDGSEGIVEAKRLNLNSCITSISGNGKHLWYRNGPTLIQNSVRTLPGVDVRGEGGYVVAPPSVHENRKRYRWLSVAIAIDKLPLFPVLVFAPEKDVWIKPKEESWIAKALEEMTDGNIDNTLTSVLGRLRHDGYSEEDARSFLEPHCQRVGAEDGHLEDKIKNIWNRYKPKVSSMRLHTSGSESLLLSSENRLIIHSPTNPDSIKQFESSKLGEWNTDWLKSGYSKLDEMLKGGLKSSRLFTVAARTGVGKTNWLIGVSRFLCENDKRVLLFSTEMPYAQIWERYIQTLPNPEQFKGHEFYICDSFAPNLERVEEAIKEIKPDVFMFDHINHVSEEQRELGAFMQGLNFLRRKYECAGIVTAQLNRLADWVDLKTGEKVTPRMSMIKGSGTIEQASSRVLLLSETRVIPEGTEIIGNLDKNDNGDKGLIHFMLKKNPYRMVEL